MMPQSHIQEQQQQRHPDIYYHGNPGGVVMPNGMGPGNGINSNMGVGAVSLQQQQDFVNAVISILEVPKDPTAVATCYANDKNTASEVQAYAKIAGKDWTYYLKDIVITIGRNTSPGDNSVDIDLGPAKVVSRQHATIKFNSNSALWELHVTGRNGAKVNFHRVNSGQNSTPQPLSSGSILDIGGTQMMFILPDQGPYIDPNAVAHLTPKLFMAYYNVTTNPLLRNLFDSNPELVRSLERSANSHHGPISAHGSQTQLLPQSRKSLQQQHHNPHQQQMVQSSMRAFKMYDDPDSAMRSDILSPMGGHMFGSHEDNDGHGMSHTNSSGLSNGQLYGTVANTGFNIASTDVSTDLSRDENRNIKPPHSYATMITQAILSTEEGELSLSDIYKHIATNYSYYRYTKAGWQNSIRHNLSLNKAFEKVPRKPGEPGKGMKWRISEETQRDFLEKWQSGKMGKVRRGSSVTRQLQAHMAHFNSLPIQRENFSFNDQRQSNGKSQSNHNSEFKQKPKLENNGKTISRKSQSPNLQGSDSQSSNSSYTQQDHESSRLSPSHPHPSDLPLPKRQHLNPPQQHGLKQNPQSESQKQNQQQNNLHQSQQFNPPAPSSNHTKSPNNQEVPSNVSSSGSLLHSPNKHFQVSAVEAYTPERGSNLQKSPQPLLNLPSLPQSIDMGHAQSSSEQGIPHLPPKSSPGVMNLLQFSSVNNTPSTNVQRTPVSNVQAAESLDGRDSRSNMLVINDAYQESNSTNGTEKQSILETKRVQNEDDNVANDNENDNDNENENGIMSSPIKVNDQRNTNLVVDDSNDHKVVVKSD